MVSHEQPDENWPDTGSASPSRSTEHQAPEVGSPDQLGRTPRRTWFLVIAAGIIAGTCSWLATEGVLRAYRPALMPPMKPMPTMEDARLIYVARVESGTVLFAAMGGLLGLTLGLAGGLSRGSPTATLMAGGIGLLAGTCLVAVVSWATLRFVYTQLDPQDQDLLAPILYHEALWSIAGMIGGLAFGIGAGGRGRWMRTMVGGWLGAALAVVLNEMFGALAFPTHQTQFPVSSSPETRAMAHLLVAIGAAICIAIATAEPKAKAKTG